jgi:hypothetical protein
MSHFPHLSNKGYLIQQVLGQNHEGGGMYMDDYKSMSPPAEVISKFKIALRQEPEGAS